MRIRLLELLSLMLLLVNAGLTQQLWTTAPAYPQIPLFAIGLWLPTASDTILLISALIAILAVVFGMLMQITAAVRGEWIRRSGWAVLAVCLISLIILDQHRLQVWVWQIVLIAVCFASLTGIQAITWLRRLTIAIYFYSAVSKLDDAFFETYGQTLLGGLLQSVSITVELPAATAFWLTILFPVGELAIAVLLAFQRTRYVGWLGSLVMHVCLILTLGPLGLNHHLPVLVWNFFFLLQNTLIFTGASRPRVVASSSSKPVSVTTTLTRLCLWLALLFPATEWVDICDVWPGWGLYSARGARARLYVSADHLVDLPEPIRPFVNAGPPTQRWYQVDLHRWSFTIMGVPSYPEDRYQLAVATAVLNELPADTPFLIRHLSTANRFNGQRTETILKDRQQLQQFAQRYWLNLRQRLGNNLPVTILD